MMTQRVERFCPILGSEPTVQKISQYALIVDFDGLFFKKSSHNTTGTAVYAQTLAPDYRSTLAFLEECRRRGHKLFSITTLSSSLFDFLKDIPHSELLFSYFSDIVCSESFGTQKSDPQLIKHFLAIHHLDPRACVMIDDQPQALTSALQAGIIKTVLCKNSDLSLIRSALASYGVL